MSEVKRDSFVFYRSFKESLEELCDIDKLVMYEAISDYALDKTEPKLTGFPKALFSLIKPQLDANWQRFENGKKGAESGKKGGRPKTPKKPQENPTRTPNVNDNVNNNIGEFFNSQDNVFDELCFENIWTLYEKKGNKKTSLQRWNKLSNKSKKLALVNIPLYIKNNQEIKFRKNFETYLNQEVWNDEITTNNTADEESKYKYYE